MTGAGKATATAGVGLEAGPLFDDTSLTQVSLAGPRARLQVSLAGARARATFYTLTSGRHRGAGPGELGRSRDRPTARPGPRSTAGAAQVFPWRRQARPFQIARPGAYAHYRLEATPRTAGRPVTLAEVELLAPPGG